MIFREDNLQTQCAQYLDFKRLLWCHVANERKTSPKTGKRLKRKGVKSGVPDCLIFNRRNGYAGLAIEIKTERFNGLKKNGEPRATIKTKLTDSQKYWLAKLKEQGWYTCVVYNFEDFKRIVDNYLRGKL